MVILQDDQGKPSMLEKSLERRRVNKEHNSNFRAGHVAVHEAHLHKTGLRGRKGYLAVCFLLCLALVAIINFMLTLWILYVVKINRHGSNTFAFLSDGTIRFQTPSEFGLVHLLGEGTFFGGFKDRNIEVSSNNETLTLRHSSLQSGPKVQLSDGEIAFQGKGGFQVINPATGQRIFSPEELLNLKFLPEAKLRSEGGVEVSKIVSPTGHGLQLQSERYIDIHGSEGVSLRSREISLTGKNIDLIGVTEIGIESQSAGIYLNTSLVPKKLHPNSLNEADHPVAYRLCICGNNGRLFKVEVKRDTVRPCQELSESFNLCQ